MHTYILQYSTLINSKPLLLRPLARLFIPVILSVITKGIRQNGNEDVLKIMCV